MGNANSDNPELHHTCKKVTITEEDRANATFYSTTSQQSSSNYEEGLEVCGKQNDHRKKCPDPTIGSLGSYTGQLFLKFENEKNVRAATGTLIGKSPNPEVKILTCAHGVIQHDCLNTTKWIIASGGEFNLASTKNNKHGFAKFSITAIHIHPDYKKSAIDGYLHTSGCDLAVLDCKLESTHIDFDNLTVQNMIVWSKFGQNHSELPTKVYGYPGDSDKSGHPYEMDGNIHKVHTRNKGKVLEYRNIQTTGGQSGSPVLVKNGGQWEIIGVHTGSAREGNVATALCEKKYDWINSLWNVDDNLNIIM